jgi:hypothetical protein
MRGNVAGLRRWGGGRAGEDRYGQKNLAQNNTPLPSRRKEAVLFRKKEPKNFYSLRRVLNVPGASTKMSGSLWFYFSKKLLLHKETAWNMSTWAIPA